MSVFNHVSVTRPKKSTFNLSHEKKLSMKFGQIVPILAEEVVPGDTWRVNTESLVRFAPMLAPIMHRIDAFIHYFFVPNRIIWDEWEDFITGGEDGLTKPVPPTLSILEENKYIAAIGSLYDYFGLPTIDPSITVTASEAISLLPFRAYQKIYNEYYRDQNLQDEIDYTNVARAVELRYRAWQKDYFTSALPWAQRGPDVALPIEMNYTDYSTAKYADDGSPAGSITFRTSPAGIINDDPVSRAIRIENLEVGNAAELTINDLRKSNRVQQWYEKSARFGSRYVEQLLGHFGVISKDARLQRPEYIGGGRTPVSVSEVLNTTGIVSQDGGDVQGGMSGHGVAVGNTPTMKRYFTEHGWIMGLLTVMPKPAYQQGINKKWLRSDKFDYYFPEFANLGEQEIQNRELYKDWTTNNSDNRATFGYQERYAEYKYIPSTVHGDFRESLDFWHMGRKFANRPNLNEDFIKLDDTDIKRIFAVQDGTDYLWIQIYNDIRAIRPMPVHAIPRM